MKRILYDLSLGHSSQDCDHITQQTRLLFSALSHSRLFCVDALIMGVNREVFSFNGRNPNSDLEEQSIFLGPYLNSNDLIWKNSFMNMIGIASDSLRHLLLYFSDYKKKLYSIQKIKLDYFQNILLRSYFADSVSKYDILAILHSEFYWSRLTHQRIIFGANQHGLIRKDQSWLEYQKINAQKIKSMFDHQVQCGLDLGQKKFDAVVFQNILAVTIPMKTKKIICYRQDIHQLFTNEYLQSAIKNIIGPANKNKTIFVCDSTSSVARLSEVSQQAASQAHIIPDVVSVVKKQTLSSTGYRRLVRLRLMDFHASKKNLEKTMENLEASIEHLMICVGDFSDSKNLSHILTAWWALRIKNQKHLKLILINEDDNSISNAMFDSIKTYIASGQLLVLQNLLAHEYLYFYSQAQCIIFANQARNDLTHIVHAMQCGCPLLLPNHTIYKNICHDAAFYYNTNHVKDILSKMQKYGYESKSPMFKKKYLKKAKSNAQKYSPQQIRSQWEELLS